MKKFRREQAQRLVPPVFLLGLTILLFGCKTEEAKQESASRRPNFIVVVIDMLRPDHLGVYGYEKQTSPNLDRWASSGLVFENAYSAAPWTYPSTVSLFTGLFPAEHGADKREVRREPFELRMSLMSDPDAWLPRQFERAGYRTAAFHSHRFLHRSVSNIYEAFGEYYYTPEARIGAKDLAREPAPWNEAMYVDTLYATFEPWLERQGRRPFLAYLHLIDVHGPYTHLRLLEEDIPEVEEGLRKGNFAFKKMPTIDMYEPAAHGPHKSYLYDGHMAMVDEYLGKLREKLETLELAEDTYVIVTSDHGEGFGEHDDYWGHGKFVFDSEIRVPLIFLGHKSLEDQPARTAELVTTVGLFPTLAEMAEIQLRDDTVASRSFLDVLDPDLGVRRRRAVVAETRFSGHRAAFMLQPRYKLIAEPQGDSIYDLQQDPREQTPWELKTFRSSNGDALDELLALRDAYRDSDPIAPASTRQIEESDIEALRGLGYLQ